MVNPSLPNQNVNKPQPEKEKKTKNFDVKIFLLCGVLAVVCFFGIKMYINSTRKWQDKSIFSGKPFTFSKKSGKSWFLNMLTRSLSSRKKFSASQTDSRKLKSQNLVLNGIFISSDKKLALINNIIVKEGDAIGDVLVLRINFDYVELGNSSRKFQLRPHKE